MRAALPLFALALAAAGCGDVEIKPDSRSGPDFERGGALQLFPDKLTDDYVDAEAGDNTDFKFVKVADKGFLTLTVYWDNKRVQSTVNVRDRFGVLLASRAHSPELEKDVIELRVEPGTHFIELRADKGASVYTIEAIFQRFDHNPEDDVRPEAVGLGEDLLAAPIPEAVPIEPRPRARGGRPSGTRPAPQPRRPRATAPAGIPATIVRLLPARGGGATIHLNRGESHGIAKGMGGYVLDDNGKKLQGSDFSITQASGKRAQAVTRLSVGQIGTKRRVVVVP